MICGVDPGCEGGLAILGSYVTVVPFKQLDGSIDIHWLSGWFIENRSQFEIVALEEVHAIFGSSAGATFSFGWGFGAIEGILTALRIPYTLIKPKAWQKELGIIHKPGTTPKEKKEKNTAECRRLFPNINLLRTERSSVPHLGMVDALLIAEAMRRRLGREGRDEITQRETNAEI